MSGTQTQTRSARSSRLKTLLPRLVKGRFFITDEPFESFRNVTQPAFGDKPEGLWYSCGDHWFRFLLTEAESLPLKRYVYKLQINTEFVLRVKGAKAIDEFTQAHRVKFPLPNEVMWSVMSLRGWINWEQVARAHAGVEIAPYCWSRRLSPHTQWYYGWDVASGCLWDEKAFKKVTLLADLDE